jgi:hypothetical protein
LLPDIKVTEAVPVDTAPRQFRMFLMVDAAAAVPVPVAVATVELDTLPVSVVVSVAAVLTIQAMLVDVTEVADRLL